MTSRSLLASELAERLRMRPELSASACWEEEEGGQAGRDRSKGSLVADLITVSRALRDKKKIPLTYTDTAFENVNIGSRTSSPSPLPSPPGYGDILLFTPSL